MNYLMGHSIRAAAVLMMVCLALASAESFDGASSRAETAGVGPLRRTGRHALDPARGSFNGKIVFSSDRHNSALSIWTINPDGSSPVRLTDGRSRSANLPAFVHVYDDSPSCSPDGTRIAFISNRNYVFSLYMMNADGSNVQFLTDKVNNLAGAAWSPDGQRIAVVGGMPSVFGPAEPFTDIYLVNVNDGGLAKLTSNSGLNQSPSWSPDGRQIVFSSNRDPDRRSKLWVMNADGSGQKRLTDIHNTTNSIFYDDMMPAWSPDGTKILFTGSRDYNGTRNCFSVNCSELLVMNADGSDDHAITNDPNRGGAYVSPKWSPDGTRIVTSVAQGTIADVRNSVDLGRAIIVMNANGGNQINLSPRSDRAFFDVSVDWQPLSGPAISSSSVLSFSASSFTAFEDSGSVPVTVKRTGNLNAPASCYYATADASATVRNDYAPVFGSLRFKPGEASKTITVPLTDSANARGDRSFKIRLFDNEGNATFVGGLREASVTIVDRDAVPRSNNPIDDTHYFVRQHYVDFLNREPDPDGLAFWVNQIESCGANAQCREVKQINVSAAFYLSIEFQETGYFAYRFNLLNPYNVNDTGFLTIVREMQEISQGVVVGQTGWQERLNSNKLSFVQRFYDDDRLALSFGRTNAEFVDLLFQYVNLSSGMHLPQTKRDSLVSALEAGTETRPQVFVDIADDEQFKTALFNQVFVSMEYYGYLRRDPDQPGYSFWLDKLNRFHGNYIDAEMVKAFLSSFEYRSRFA